MTATVASGHGRTLVASQQHDDAGMATIRRARELRGKGNDMNRISELAREVPIKRTVELEARFRQLDYRPIELAGAIKDCWIQCGMNLSPVRVPERLFDVNARFRLQRSGCVRSHITMKGRDSDSSVE